MRVLCRTYDPRAFELQLQRAARLASRRFAKYLLRHHRETAPRRTGIFADRTHLVETKHLTSIATPRIRHEAARMFARRGQTIFGGEPTDRAERFQQICDEVYRGLRPKLITR